MTKDGSDADKKLWQHVAASVRPLESRKKPVIKKAAKPGKAAAKDKPSTAASVQKQRSIESSAPPLARVTRHETPGPRFNTGFDAATETKLKKGKLPIEGRIDLHGMTQDEAYRALTRFVQSARRSGKRTLLVITGKGKVSTGGVLRRNVPLWLEGNSAVLALTPAAPQDGGSGAFYLRLRKNPPT